MEKSSERCRSSCKLKNIVEAIELDREEIPGKTSMKYLGVTINSMICFNAHANMKFQVATKVSSHPTKVPVLHSWMASMHPMSNINLQTLVYLAVCRSAEMYLSSVCWGDVTLPE